MQDSQDSQVHMLVQDNDLAQKAKQDKEMQEFWAEVSRNEARSNAAAATGAPALQRLLVLAETRRSGQIELIAQFLGAIWNGKRHFDLYDLRRLDREISNDVLAVLDAFNAFRWGNGIDELVPDGSERAEAILEAWNMYGAGQTGQCIC